MPDLDPALEPSTASDEGFLRIENVRAGEVFRPAHTQSYARFFDLVDEIVSVAGAVPISLLLIPDALQVDDALWRRVRAAAPHEEYERDLPQRLLRAHFDAQGYHYVDLLPSFRAVRAGADGERHLYQRNDAHINVRGNVRAHL